MSDLFALFQWWTFGPATQRHRILVTNPAKLHGFPNCRDFQNCKCLPELKV